MESTEAKAATPAETGEKTKAVIAGAPDVMAELMRAFIEQKDLNARVKIRLRMKALLDLVAVDTLYPKNPALDGGARGHVPRHGGGFMEPAFPQPPPMGDIGGALRAEVGRHAGPGGIEPVPGAAPIDNADVLG